ncbi:molybdopterin-binding protein [Roseomonas fluvialis]|uniref:Molybdopterin molybdenumtransferase n=1 Tax=Roseomonas fluvialis TaxID=1750527 RepID=A0ABM7Y691_9PROT|nr:molybdopterin-binding protein [Roseomonas fluvialis]BDG73514.1 molybdopterin-binding protein [Roseomonas fluvialis]
MTGLRSLTVLDEATALLLAGIAAVAPRSLPLAEAVGCVLAVPLEATAPAPPCAVARWDGWAIAAADTLGAGPYAPAVLSVPPRLLQPGDALPPGTDAVLPLPELVREGPFAQVLDAVAPGSGVRWPGEDAAAGTLLRAAGERLSPLDLPVLAALGVTEVAVRRPRLGWLAIGDEIMADGGRDTLFATCAALAQAAGAALLRLPPAPDDAAAIAGALRAGAEVCDLLLAVGGTGDGAGDVTAAGLREAGRLALHGIGARPGTTAGFGEVALRPVVLLPGSPGDAPAAWLLLVRPALDALTGAVPTPPLRARLARKVTSTVGLVELAPLRRLADGRAEPLATGALPLHALASGAVLILPAASEGAEAGTEITITLFWPDP